MTVVAAHPSPLFHVLLFGISCGVGVIALVIALRIDHLGRCDMADTFDWCRGVTLTCAWCMAISVFDVVAETMPGGSVLEQVGELGASVYAVGWLLGVAMYLYGRVTMLSGTHPLWRAGGYGRGGNVGGQGGPGGAGGPGGGTGGPGGAGGAAGLSGRAGESGEPGRRGA